MPVNIKTTQVVLSAGAIAATQDITISGFGTPKAAIFIYNTGKSNDTAQTAGEWVMQGIGWTDGTNQYAMCISDDDGNSGSLAKTCYSSSRCIEFGDASSGFINYKLGFNFNSWITDGVRISVTIQGKNEGISPLCTVILIGGTDVQVKSQYLTFNNSTTPKAHTGVGFQPDLLVLSYGGRTSYRNDLAASYGFSFVTNEQLDGHLKHMSSSFCQVGSGNSVGNIRALSADDRFAGYYVSGAANQEVRINSIDSDGFTSESLGVQNLAGYFGALSLKFTGGYSASIFRVDVLTSGDLSISGLPITPDFGWLAVQAGTTIWGTKQASGTYLSGYGHVVFDDTNISSVTFFDDDGAGTINWAMMQSQSFRVVKVNTGDAYHSTSYTLDDAGFTFTTTTSPPEDFLGAGLAIGKNRPVTKSLLHLDGDIGSASIADDDVFDATDEDFTFEFTSTAANLTSTAVLLSNTPDATSRSVQVDLVDDDLKLYLSSDGTTWDISNGTVIGTITASRFYCEVERIGNEIIYRLGGIEQGRIYTSAALAAGGDWTVGNYASTLYYDGIIHAWRFMIGKYRYGIDHAVIATPFADSDTYGAGIVYSDKPSLMWNDIAQSIFYGLGATTVGVIESTDWGDELLDDGVTPRCRVGLTISSPSRAEYWLDILANYANCVWYPDGSDLRIAPDQESTSEAPSGLDIVYNGIFDTI